MGEEQGLRTCIVRAFEHAGHPEAVERDDGAIRLHQLRAWRGRVADFEPDSAPGAVLGRVFHLRLPVRWLRSRRFGQRNARLRIIDLRLCPAGCEPHIHIPVCRAHEACRP